MNRLRGAPKSRNAPLLHNHASKTLVFSATKLLQFTP
nr:MAG TPA: hypothetical protein [Caudoviricetes sp.]